MQDPSKKFTPSADRHFNRGVGKGGSALYCLDVDGLNDRISFQHAGVSSMIASSVLSLDRVGSWPRHVSFVVPRGHISFSDVRVYVGNQDTHLLEHECAWQFTEPEHSSPAEAGGVFKHELKIAFRSEPEEGWVSKVYGYIELEYTLPI